MTKPMWKNRLLSVPLTSLRMAAAYFSSTALVSVVVATSLLLAAGFFAAPTLHAYFENRSNEESRATLRLVTGGIDQAIRRFSPLPELIAEIPIVQSVLNEPENQGLVPFLNEKLRLLAISLGVSDVYLMDTDGRTIAASNYRLDTSFIGRNFDYRPYFIDALSGDSTIFHAIGTTSNEPGFFFAAPVLDGVDIAGVLAVKVTTESLESGWAAAGRDIMVADSNGIIFLTSRPALRYRSLAPLSADVRQWIETTRQFPLDVIQPLDASTNLIRPGSVELEFALGPTNERYLSNSSPLSIPGWHAIVITPLAPILTRSYYVLAFWALGVLAIALAVYAALQRRARVMERMEAQRVAQDLLENRVAVRTADLNAANAHLRQTQTKLVQAGKLAALGQMSAALSHEINQPLAAVKSYAANAATFLDRGQTDDARDNVIRISSMADRMAAISGHLRNFARRPQEDIGPIDLCKAVEDALALMQPRLKATGARVDLITDGTPRWVNGGQLRLQQVIINLLNNALDAMDGVPDTVIQLGVAQVDNGEIEITVADRGPGLSVEAREHLFDPFFTTKTPGKGLGLGLSISYNIVEDFGGRLEARNRDGGGTEFSIILQACEPPSGTGGSETSSDSVAAE